MVFSSLEFIFRFLPVFLIVYYMVPPRFRNLVLFLGSIAFYSFGDPHYLILIFLSVIVNQFAAVKIKRREKEQGRKKAWLIFALVYNFGMLFFFKYINFTIENVNALFPSISLDMKIAPLAFGLPLGISFYSFHAVSYVIDVYRGEIQGNLSLFEFGTYLFLFPKLVSGPIIPYGDIKDQLHNRKYDSFELERGVKLFTIGLGMKVLLANRIGTLWNDIQTIGFQSISTPLAWLGALGYSLQLYFDFYGYTLMAMGIGRMLGFHLPNNFNHPYMAGSVTEFWRRWHITLGKWLKDYVYIPLGGNRKGKSQLAFNLLLVWLFTGLWHGAGWNFVLWGLTLFALILLEKLYLKPFLDKWSIFARLYMLLVIPITWMLFAIRNPKDICTYFGRMFGTVPGINVNAADIAKYFGQYRWLLLAGIFFCFPYGQRWFAKYKNSIFCTVLLFLVFWFSVYQLANGINNPFMYFRF